LSAQPRDPLTIPLFRAFWIAALVSNLGSWMQEVGAAWYMTSLTTSPVLVSFVQFASTLPLFLFALPAGSLGDIVDRRKILIYTQISMLASAAVLSVTAFAGRGNPFNLLVLTFLFGVGNAIYTPASQAIMPEIVERCEIKSAATLNTAGVNISGAIGPVLAGFAISLGGPALTFLLNAVSLLMGIVVAQRWKRRVKPNALPVERLVGSIKIGLRFARNAPVFRSLLVRTTLFIVGASAIWALIPLLRFEMGLNALTFALLYASFCAGAVVESFIQPMVRRKWSTDTLTFASTAIYAMATLVIGLVHNYYYLAVALAIGGGAWLAIVSSYNASAQLFAPSWVQARALGVYFLLVFQGGLAIGCVVWGEVAEFTGSSLAFILAGVVLMACLIPASWFRLAGGEKLDLSPSMKWPAPTVIAETPSDGPVMVTVQYKIDPENAEEFKRAMDAVRLERLRDGAFRWELYRRLDDPGLYQEVFVLESWAEHERQHARATQTDMVAENRARAFIVGGGEPTISHFTAERARRQGAEAEQP